MSGIADLYMTIDKVRAANEMLLEALYIALPFVEDAELDEGYKKGAVTRSVKFIKEAIKQAEEA
jgi:hypothetical protein